METGEKDKIQNARALFQEQLTIFQHFIPMYNIACCEALLGNSKEALTCLQKAIAAGYRDVDHIEKDEDLKSLYSLDEFKAIVSSLKSASTAAKSPVAPTTSTATTATNSSSATTTTVEKKPEPVSTPAPVAETKPVEPAPAPSTENLALLEGMGFTDKQKNVDALTRAKGDMAAAVQILIDGQRLYKWY
jgi:cell division septation protein DedD